MKTIAILLHSFTIEYSLEILRGIIKFYENKDVRLVMAQVKAPNYKKGVYEYQCWTGADLLTSKEVDAVIVISGSITSENSIEEISKALSAFKDIPIFSIAADLGLPNSYYTDVECASAFDNVITHLKNKHGRKRIAFMSANPVGSKEAIDRFEAYKAGLKNNGLEYDENLVMGAYYTIKTSYAVFKQKYTCKEDVDFDALIAANDLMAIGCMTALQEYGFEIPKDICIVGFDDTSHAERSTPKLSTINQNIFAQGQKSAELVWQLLQGQEIPKKTLFSCFPVYRQSCGCIALDNYESEFVDADGNKQSKNAILHNRNQVKEEFFSALPEIDRAYNLFDMVNSENTLRKLFYVMPFLMDTAQIDAFALYLYSKPVIHTVGQKFTIPAKASLTMFLDNTTDEKIFEPDFNFDPAFTLHIADDFKDKPGTYILQPVFSGPQNYGYIVCRISNQSFPIYSLHLKIIVNAITQAYEYTKTLSENKDLLSQNEALTQNNSDLSKVSTTDELTEVLNRRGFMEIGQRTIEIATAIHTNGLVFFVDMDNLKKINDSYGHKMGDKAIRSMALVLTKILRSNDIVGRIGGDEFAMIMTGMSILQEDLIRDKIEAACRKEEAAQKYPFKLSCSLGAVEFNGEHKSITKLLATADERLYIEKRRKHMNQQ